MGNDGGWKNILLMAKVLLPVVRCEQARLVLTAATRVRTTLVTHSQGKIHLPPLPAAGSAPAPCLLGEVVTAFPA